MLSCYHDSDIGAEWADRDVRASYRQVDGNQRSHVPLPRTRRVKGRDVEIPVAAKGPRRQRPDRLVADQKSEIAQQQECRAV